MHNLQARCLTLVNHRNGKLTTDRIRRVKCDEQKPNCFRCTSTGRKCDGYQFDITPGQSGRLVHNISLVLPGTLQERRAFEFFRSCTVTELCGYFPDEFWERNVLQASFSHPAIRHGVIALGALHEGYKAVLQPETKIDDLVYFALRQHTKGLSNLGKSLSSGNQQTQVALMSCIVFSCFDRLTSDIDSAITHLRSGLEILRNTPLSDSYNYFRILKRMTMESVSFLDADKEEKKLDFWEMAIPDPCDDLPRFTSICEAQYSLNSIVSYILYFLYAFQTPKTVDAKCEQLIRHQKSSLMFCIPGMSNLDSPYSKDALRLFAKERMEWAISQHRFFSMIQAWSRKLDAYLLESNLDPLGRDLQAATLLRTHWLLLTINMEGTLSPAKFSSPNFFAKFQKIVALCKSIVTAENAAKPPQFSIDLGIICPLYFTGLNCRDPGIRQQVLELLATPRREGMWDSQVATHILSQTIAREEEIAASSPNKSDISTPTPAVIAAEMPSRSLREVINTARLEMRRECAERMILPLRQVH